MKRRTSCTPFAQLIQDLSSNAASVVIDAISPGMQAMPSFVGLGGNGVQHAGAPKAYLNMMVFDRNFQQIGTTLYTQISTAAEGTDRKETARRAVLGRRQAAQGGTDVAHEFIPVWPVTITEAGYVYIYLSNENGTPMEVFFDDFKVNHFPSNVVQKDDYYPYGGTFNSYTVGVENLYKFNSKELQKETDWYD